MTFLQAARICVATKLHIRRESWPADKWIWKHGNTPYGPTWYIFRLSGTEKERNGTQVTRGGDVVEEDYRADDWTTMPAPLVSCPVTPGIPIGGGPPVPGTPGWPSVPDPGFPSFPGSPGGGGDPSITLPPPDPGTSLSVTFSGITDTQTATDDDPAVYFDGDKLNRRWTLEFVGPGHWKKSAVEVGYFKHPHVEERLKIFWNIEVTKTAGGLFSVSLSLDPDDSENVFLSGGFLTNPGTEKARFVAISNGADSPIRDGVMCYGYATVN
jgi:hypothetical protein